MKKDLFTTIFNSQLKTLSRSITEKKDVYHLKGLRGSYDSLISTQVINQAPHLNHVFVFDDKIESTYFQNDLQNLLGRPDVYLFPTSYKRPYHFEEIENANVLLRTEVLGALNQTHAKSGVIITCYAESLLEKVINRQSLLENTYPVKKNDDLDAAFLDEFLIEYGFEKTDFVHEPGQYAVRGGIIDVFSFNGDYPYRIELFGDAVDSIRLFDPNSQLSKDEVPECFIIPNLQSKLFKETRQSFLDFVSPNTIFWFKDLKHTLDTINQNLEKVEENFKDILKVTNNTKTVLEPNELFESLPYFQGKIRDFSIVEFGNRYHLGSGFSLDFNIKPQPSFNKNFDLIIEDLNGYYEKGYEIIISVESEQQHERLKRIFDEIDPDLTYQILNYSLRGGFIDEDNRIVFYTDHQLFNRYFKFKAKEKFSKSKSLTLRELKTLQPGDYVVHIDYGVGRFAGLDKVEINGSSQEAVRLVYRDDDLLYVGVHSLHKISKYSANEGVRPTINKLGSQEWDNKKKKVKKKVKDIAKDLINLYAKRKAAPGFAFPQDNYLQTELESSFIYQDTPDQAKATDDVKTDMEQPHPMDRLICGDVGFGKTEVAIRAAFKAVSNGKQVAVLVPTTILALQHYNTFKDRLSNFPVNVEFINRFRSTKEIKKVIKNLSEGKVDILIGTHRLVNKDVIFKELGLLIIDEEQKFGVKIKEKLKEIRVNVDTLTLTATPIPRTLQFSLMGSRDLSIISTPPPNRQPVVTQVHEYQKTIIRDAIHKEIKRGGQVFFVHNRIKDIEHEANVILSLVPDARIGIAHGQMEGDKLENVMLKFINGDYDVLVSTNIIESGLDIPNANTIIINRAHMFGLSDIHQMRGRVGRSNTKAYCYLLAPSTASLTSEAKKRLNTIEEFSDLGDGIKVSMRDLDIRGAGNLLGGEQSGFISDLGYDMYHKILDEAVQELKDKEFKDLFKNISESSINQMIKNECSIETDFEILFPDTYISNISERLSLYNALDNLKDENDLESYKKSLADRFGPLPNEVKELIKTIPLRWNAIEIGFEKLIIKNNIMKCYFKYSKDEDYYNSEIFTNILEYVKQNGKYCKLKEYKNKLILIFNEVKNIDIANELLEEVKNVEVVA